MTAILSRFIARGRGSPDGAAGGRTGMSRNVSEDEGPPEPPSRRSLLENPLPLLLAVGAFATLVAGAVLWFAGDSSQGEVTIVLPTPTSQAPAELKVYLSGAVRKPGVYLMAAGDRVIDAVEAAGGATEDAALESVNLAGRLKDEDHWHIPAVGEETAYTPAVASDGPAVLDLNTATAEQLMSLPGIGEAKAAAIVSYREDIGRFDDVEDLLEVRGVGDAIVEGLRDLVVIR